MVLNSATASNAIDHEGPPAQPLLIATNGIALRSCCYYTYPFGTAARGNFDRTGDFLSLTLSIFSRLLAGVDPYRRDRPCAHVERR